LVGIKLKIKNKLSLKNLGINTHKEPIVYMRADCFICKSEGFNAQARVMVMLNQHSIIATLNIIETDLLKHNEASLSNYAWKLLLVFFFLISSHFHQFR
jgi:thymidine phosphorylase